MPDDGKLTLRRGHGVQVGREGRNSGAGVHHQPLHLFESTARLRSLRQRQGGALHGERAGGEVQFRPRVGAGRTGRRAPGAAVGVQEAQPGPGVEQPCGVPGRGAGEVPRLEALPRSSTSMRSQGPSGAGWRTSCPRCRSPWHSPRRAALRHRPGPRRAGCARRPVRRRRRPHPALRGGTGAGRPAPGGPGRGRAWPGRASAGPGRGGSRGNPVQGRQQPGHGLPGCVLGALRVDRAPVGPQRHGPSPHGPGRGAQRGQQHPGERGVPGDPQPHREGLPVGVRGMGLGHGPAAAHHGPVFPVGEHLVRRGAVAGARGVPGRERGGQGVGARARAHVSNGSSLQRNQAPPPSACASLSCGTSLRGARGHEKRVLPVRLPSRTGSTLHLPSVSPPSPRG